MPKENILIVDDEIVILNTSSEILRRAGYNVITVSSGEDGYEQLKAGEFDVVITDIKMSGMGGMTLIKKIREDVSADIPIIVITGHGTIDTAIESMKQGAQGFILKPFTPHELKSSVEDVIRKNDIIKENLRLKAFIPIFEMNKKLLSELDINSLLKSIVEESSRYTSSDRASLMLLEDDGSLILKASIGLEVDSDTAIRLKIGEGIAGWVAENREPLLLNEDSDIPQNLKDMMKSQEIRSALCIPIIIKEKLHGVLNLSKTTDSQPFTHSDMELVSVLCGQAAIALENSRLYGRVQYIYIGIIATLASAIEARDPYTAGHAIRMAEYSKGVAVKMGVSDREIETIYRAGILHDIGKIGIPDHILLKKGSLNEDEVRIMRDHPEIGGKILDKMDGLGDVAAIVRQHHTYFDGRNGLDNTKGKEILLGARIIAVADAFEAMTSVRPYKKAISVSEAVKELKKMSGSQFDPEVVDAFVDMLNLKEMI
ncbi:MAG: response regulator [Nitrospinae bacterium]|nr:response regulator [Nitrospinota bacterium]